jgi:hypothetical protein
VPKSRALRVIHLVVLGIVGTIAFVVLGASVVCGAAAGRLIRALPENAGKDVDRRRRVAPARSWTS